MGKKNELSFEVQTLRTFASFSNVLARRGVQSRMASPATAINHGGQPCRFTEDGSSGGLRRSGAGMSPVKLPACLVPCLSRALTAFPLSVPCRRRRRATAPAGVTSAQPILQRWQWTAADEYRKRIKPP